MRVLWFCGPASSARCLEEHLEDTEIVPLDLHSGQLRLPSGAQPIGLVLPASATVLSDVERARRRGLGPILVLTDAALPPERSHQLLRAGVTAVVRSPCTGTSSASARSRAGLRLRKAVSLLASFETIERAPVFQDKPERILIGASTGGPQVLKHVLCGGALPVPVLLSQHIRAGYEVELARWLTHSGAPTRVARSGDRPEAGVILLSPGDRDMALVRGTIELRPPSTTAVPSVDVLFETAAQDPIPTTAILLTGMGADGAQGLLTLRQAGAFTVAQHAESCVVDGMPGRARDLGASCVDWPPDRIRSYLDDLRA